MSNGGMPRQRVARAPCPLLALQLSDVRAKLFFEISDHRSYGTVRVLPQKLLAARKFSLKFQPDLRLDHSYTTDEPS